MNLMHIVHRRIPPVPWADGEKIPWNDPGFSQRMLSEHLSQAHHAASRRVETIDRQVAWIHRTVLGGKSTRILDLGCGPGLYTSRLAGFGHECVGIDFSPASIAYARETARREGLACRYDERDIRAGAYGAGYGLVMLLFGEINVFRPEEAKQILASARDALADGGVLLLEPHTFAAVHRLGESGTSWYSSERGLFSAEPHLCLHESFWNAEQQVAIERYYVIEAKSGEMRRYAASTQAYTGEELRGLLQQSGFDDVTAYPSLRGDEDAEQRDFFAVVTTRRAP